MPNKVFIKRAKAKKVMNKELVGRISYTKRMVITHILEQPGGLEWVFPLPIRARMLNIFAAVLSGLASQRPWLGGTRLLGHPNQLLL